MRTIFADFCTDILSRIFFPFLDRFFFFFLHILHAGFNGEYLSYFNETNWPSCRKVRSEKEVRKRLESLKGKVGEENSFAFMFACCGRGEGHYRGQSFIMELNIMWSEAVLRIRIRIRIRWIRMFWGSWIRICIH
jgi:hypothetical protein